MIAEQAMFGLMVIRRIMFVIMCVIVRKIVKKRRAVNDFVNLPPNGRKHHCTDEQCLKKPSELSARNHLARTHSEKVFLNFQTLGAATAKQ